jgi:hypothetical protein
LGFYLIPLDFIDGLGRKKYGKLFIKAFKLFLGQTGVFHEIKSKKNPTQGGVWKLL